MHLTSIQLMVPKSYPLDDQDNLVLSVCARHNERVSAIKYLRMRYDYGLKEAKDINDSYVASYNASQAGEDWRNQQVRKTLKEWRDEALAP